MSDAADAAVIVPLELVWRAEQPLVTFGEVLVSRLAAPFWEDAIAAPRSIVAVRALDACDSDGDLGVAGAVHHMTRCGSTLVMRQFSRLPGMFALSEPPIFAQLLDGPPSDQHLTARRLRALLAAHREGLRPIAERLVLKWPALATHLAGAIAAALPEIPTLYLHRDPVEVLASIEQEGLGGDAAIRLEQIGLAGDMPTDSLERAARLIAQGCHALAATRGIASLDYADLPGAAANRIAPYFGMTLAAHDRAAMLDAARTHSKDGTDRRMFTDDSASKRRECSPVARRLADKIVAPALELALRSMQAL